MGMVIATVRISICYIKSLKAIENRQDTTVPPAALVDTIKRVDTVVLCMSIPAVTEQGGSEAECPAPVLKSESQFCHAAQQIDVAANKQCCHWAVLPVFQFLLDSVSGAAQGNFVGEGIWYHFDSLVPLTLEK